MLSSSEWPGSAPLKNKKQDWELLFKKDNKITTPSVPSPESLLQEQEMQEVPNLWSRGSLFSCRSSLIPLWNSQALGSNQPRISKTEGVFGDQMARHGQPEKGPCPLQLQHSSEMPTLSPVLWAALGFQALFVLCPRPLLTSLILRGSSAPGKWEFQCTMEIGFL